MMHWSGLCKKFVGLERLNKADYERGYRVGIQLAEAGKLVRGLSVTKAKITTSFGTGVRHGYILTRRETG